MHANMRSVEFGCKENRAVEAEKNMSDKKGKELVEVAVLDDDALIALAGLSKSVYLSAATAQKQAERHPDIRAKDYSHVQRLIDHGMAVLEGNRTMVFVGSDPAGKFWRAVVKRTADARETYLVTFHRIKPNQVAAALRRGALVRTGKHEIVAPGGAHSLLAQPKPRV